MDRSVIIDSWMYILSTDAGKQALESLQTPEGLQGMIVVPWIQQQHFMLVVGYATAGKDYTGRIKGPLQEAWADKYLNQYLL
jgi:hypothetical protein